jgi:hypothetical protein
MQDVMDIIKNVETIYNSNTSFEILKDFERVLDELDIYVYSNWENGELAFGPRITRHWVECGFMWPQEEMPDPMGGKRLTDYDCKVSYKKDYIIEPRKIEDPDDMRPGTKKGKLDRHAVWIVIIKMPKSLVADIYGGYLQQEIEQNEVNDVTPPDQEQQPADDLADSMGDESSLNTELDTDGAGGDEELGL